MLILAVKVKWWDWKKIEMIDKKRLKGLKKQDWKDWEDKIEERLHQSYQSSSIYINLKNIINQCISASNKNINRWNIHD